VIVAGENVAHYVRAMRTLLLSSVALAAALPNYAATLTFIETQNEGTTYLYEGTLQNNQRIETGDFFLVYDVRGLLSGTGPEGWVFTSIFDAPVADDEFRPDAIFTYSGPAIIGIPSTTALGNFYLTGTFTRQRSGTYLSQTTRIGDGNNTSTQLQQVEVTTVPDIPEPSTAVLGLAGLAVLVCRKAVLLRRKRVARTRC
jgi:hypothetical protein